MHAKNIAISAIMTAILITVQYALSFLLGLELVTLLIVVFVSSFKLSRTFIAVLAFCLLRNLIMPSPLDVTILYFIYYPLVTVLFHGLKKAKWCNQLYLAMFAFLFTLGFDVFSAFLSHFFWGWTLKASFAGLFVPFPLLPTHTLCAFLTVFYLEKPLTTVLKKIA